MKMLRIMILCFSCLLVFLLTGALSCAIRAKYWYVPKVRASLAYSYAEFLSDYAFLQSNQADEQQGKKALLEYLGILRRIQKEKIEYPEKLLHLYSELTDLRLYRLEMATNNPAKADEYLRSAENELAILGHKEITPEQLIKYVQAQETSDSKLYNSNTDITGDSSKTGTSEPPREHP